MKALIAKFSSLELSVGCHSMARGILPAQICRAINRLELILNFSPQILVEIADVHIAVDNTPTS